MDWFRRNWPDLVIGVALVAVVALIVVTLLSGGSLASLVRRDTPPDLITDTTGTPGTPEPTTAQATPGSASGNGASGDDGTGNDIDVFVPGVPSGATGAAGARAGSADQLGESAQAAAQEGTQDLPAGGDATPQATVRSGFRVAAGAVDSRPAAVDLAESYRERALPVTVEQQDDLYLLWVGPYATRPDADRIAARIIADGGDALVYTYDGEDADTEDADTTEAAAPQPNAAASTPQSAVPEITAPESASPVAEADVSETVAVANAPETTAEEVPAAASVDGANDAATVGQRYLQVGAFVSDESAAPLRTQLETLGLNVSRTEDETGLVRLFVGPFEEARLAQTQSRLSAEGVVGSFPVTR